MNDLKRGLIDYGVSLMARASGEDVARLVSECLGSRVPELDVGAFEKFLDVHDTAEQSPYLRAVLSMVTFGDENGSPPGYYRPVTFELSEEVIFPQPLDQIGARPELTALWEEFAGECQRALSCDDDSGFLRFVHLMRKYAWSLPCTYGEKGVSLFEQFKAVAALVFGSRSLTDPAEEYLLVGGDIPGIQDFIYTITSKGAAKELRGRSFFIQLLGDAVVRRLCDELDLSPEVNVIYAAGGNFMILAPAGAGDTLDELREAVNIRLLEEFKGDLELCLVYKAVTKEQIRGETFGDVSSALKRKIVKQKRRPFGEIARNDWKTIFAPQGTGGLRYCTITQRELEDDEPAIPLPDAIPEPGGRSPVISQQSCGFIGLAEAIGKTQCPLMVVNKEEPSPLTIDDSSPYKLYRSHLPYWQVLLWKVTGWQYDFVTDASEISQKGDVYAINAPDFLSKGADGFLFLGNVTPHISEADLEWIQDSYPDETPGKEEFIKDFGLMGQQAVGIKRVGVLRMDVDDLGRAAIEGLTPQTMTRVSTFSQSLELFFAGWLNEICEEIQANEEMLPKGFERHPTDLLYIIYSGGDDLFIVGAWDRLPLLAERIHQDFVAFVGGNPNLHISAGLTLEQRKFPLYRAAERAHDALDDGAKSYSRPQGGDKDAIAFLEQVFGWEDFAPSDKDGQFGVKEATKHLIGLLESGVSRSVLQTVQSIYGQYRRDQDRNLKRRPTCELTDEQLYYGRWMWLQVYQIQRLIAWQKDEEVKEAIKQLQRDLMDPQNVCYSGLAARWAEYLTRKER